MLAQPRCATYRENEPDIEHQAGQDADEPSQCSNGLRTMKCGQQIHEVLCTVRSYELRREAMPAAILPSSIFLLTAASHKPEETPSRDVFPRTCLCSADPRERHIRADTRPNDLVLHNRFNRIRHLLLFAATL